MRTTIKTGKEQLMDQYFSKLEKFEERLESMGIETKEYYDLLDLFRSYTMIDVKEEQAKRDEKLQVTILDGTLKRTTLTGVKTGASSVFVITNEGREELIQRAQSGALKIPC
ncbi:hypothetical protein EVJ24_14885 [Exiguobacterium sp. SH1S21]|uniref:hypothetical protein n=1 Tax=Exiguobacterium sp. SH1S21 TaxID=2510953 RepID=UPI0010390D23|nr:hypothetical protein [Exiguobacterium sp. SH1S21]TCI50324.1 hypothetical protein EVJ24_14885 [Exiguobacterium sp. SH1S21]